jgi:FAD/FMN-containing dehydrogenase
MVKGSQVSDRSSSEQVIASLRASFKGEVIGPQDAAYEQARRVFYGKFDCQPAAIVRPTNAADVASAIALAREAGLELAVRSGGHSVAGHGTSDGGIVLDLSAMKGLDINVEGRTAWAEAGLTAGEYTKAAGAHGLATGFGDTATVGIGGLTLGGGIGFLVRKYGLTIDELLAAEIVTADGQTLHVDADNHPDLFWAIRGGGGNFGVVTRFQFRLREVDSIVGGMLILPATPEVITGFIARAQAAPEELSAIANIMLAPPMPFLPEVAHGKLVIMALLAYVGDAGSGEEAIAPFRGLAEPLADMVRPMRYPEIYTMFGEEEQPGPAQEVSRSMFLNKVDRGTADTIAEYLQSHTALFAVAQLRVLGGAMARVPAEATAFAHRQCPIMVALGAIYENPDDTPAHEAWAGKFMAALDQGVTGVYSNFVSNEGAARVREAYPGSTWDRLAAVKAKYDPANFFRLNHNIPPAGKSGTQKS